jgi:hypothetical protein
VGETRFWLEADWKGFDTSVHSELLETAFAIIRSCFPSGADIDNFFIFIKNHFIYKEVVTPHGERYMFKGGIPSGNIWTSLVGSIVNWIV